MYDLPTSGYIHPKVGNYAFTMHYLPTLCIPTYLPRGKVSKCNLYITLKIRYLNRFHMYVLYESISLSFPFF